MATYPFPYLAAATYPPPFLPGGYFPLPSGFFPSTAYGAPPTFPCAASYPYQPSAAYNIHPSILSPSPAHGVVPVFSATPTCQSTATSFTPTVDSALLELPEIASLLAISNADSTRLTEMQSVLNTSPISTSHGDQSSPEHTSNSRASRMQPNRAPMALTDQTPLLLLQDNKVDDLQRHATDRLLSSSTTRKNDSAVPAHSPFDSTPEVTAVTSSTPLSSFTQSSGSSKTASTTSSLLSFGPSVFSVSAANVPSTHEHVAPQVFGEMPTPKSCPRTYGSSLHYYQEQETLVQSTLVPGGNSNLNEQHLDVMPQTYDFSNLTRQTIFLADGTEHSYFTLPVDYPIERVVHEPVFDVYDGETDRCSNDFVQVLVSTPEQQKYEDQQESEHALDCFRKPIFSPVKPTDGIFSSTNEKKPDDDLIFLCVNKATNVAFHEDATCLASLHVPHLSVGESIKCSMSNNKIALTSLPDSEPCDKHEKAQQVNNQQLNRLISDAGRKQWDPDILNTIIDGHTVVKCSYLEFLLPCLRLWDPGDTQLHVLCTTAAGTTKLQCTDACKSAMLHILVVQFGATFVFKYSTLRSYAFGVGWTGVDVPTLFFLAVPCYTPRSEATQSLLLSQSGDNRTNHSYLKLFIYSICAATTRQVTEQRPLLEHSLMVVMLLNGCECIDGQLAYMSQGTRIPSHEWVRLTVTILSCWFPSFETAKLQWDPGIPLFNYMHSLMVSDRNRSKARNALVWLRDPLFNDLQCQLTMSNNSCVWDPSIELLFSYKRLNITKMIHINSWTSMTYSGISSSAYPYIMDFLNAQLEFVHQQGVQKNYNATSLISP